MSASTFGDFSRERAARAQRLLEESEEHRGSNDVQKYIQCIEFSDQFHAVFQDGERPWEGLTVQEKQQGLVTFCRFLLATLQMPACSLVVKPPTFDAMVAAAGELSKQHLQVGAPLGPLGLLALLADAALFCVGTEPTEEGTRRQNEACVRQANQLIASWPAVCPTAVELEQLQQRAGFEPQLSLTQQRNLVSVLIMTSSRKLAMSHKQDSNQQQAQQHWEAALDACSQLVALDPADPGFRLMLGSIAIRTGQAGQLAVPALQAAVAAADASNDHWTASVAALTLAAGLASGLDGDTCSVAAVQHLLQRAEHHDGLCKAWLPAPLGSQRQLDTFRAQFAEKAAEHPGARTIPASFALDTARSTHLENLQKQRCSYCNQKAIQLKRCGACKQAAYCSVECQKLAWKGGHKRECAQLAARRG